MISKNKTTLFNIASTFLLQGLAFISGPIFSGALGTENYGIAAVYLTWVQVASAAFSLQAAGTVSVARVYFPLEEQPQYQSSVLSLATIIYTSFSVLTILVTLILKNFVTLNLHMILLGLFHGWGLCVVGFMNNKFTYEFKADKNFILSVAVSALTIGCSILLIRVFPKDENYWGRIIGQSSIYTIIGLIIFIYILKTGKVFYKKEYWKFTLPIALPTVFHVLSHILLNQSDRVMLQSMVGNSAAGIYSLACTFGAVLSSIWSALNNSWVPFYYEYTRRGQIAEMKKHAKNYIELFTVLAIGFILLSREVFHVYAKSEFWEGTDLIPLFSIGYYFVFLYSFPVNFEFYNKKTKTIAIGTTATAIFNIILNYFLIRWNGILGAVIATGVAHAALFVFHLFRARRLKVEEEFPFKTKEFMPGFIVVCAICIFYWFTRNIWYIRWGIAVVLGIYELWKMIRRKEIF